MNERKITRVDLEKAGTDIVVKKWYEGWSEGSPADITSNEPRAFLVSILMKLEKEGFTVEMADSEHGRALRGTITRVDIVSLPDGFHYRKFPFGWTARTRPMSDERKTEEEVAEIIGWCKQKGWNVREWPGGYRAFKGAPMPVRDKASILTMRRKVEQDMALGRAHSDNRSQYDFALDF